MLNIFFCNSRQHRTVSNILDSAEQSAISLTAQNSQQYLRQRRTVSNILDSARTVSNILDSAEQSAISQTAQNSQQYLGQRRTGSNILDSAEQAAISWTAQNRQQYLGQRRQFSYHVQLAKYVKVQLIIKFWSNIFLSSQLCKPINTSSCTEQFKHFITLLQQLYRTVQTLHNTYNCTEQRKDFITLLVVQNSAKTS